MRDGLIFDDGTHHKKGDYLSQETAMTFVAAVIDQQSAQERRAITIDIRIELDCTLGRNQVTYPSRVALRPVSCYRELLNPSHRPVLAIFRELLNIFFSLTTFPKVSLESF